VSIFCRHPTAIVAPTNTTCGYSEHTIRCLHFSSAPFGCYRQVLIYIGSRLPILLADGRFEQVDMHMVQPMATRGEVKLINPIRLGNIADAILQDGLAWRREIDMLVHELYA
jgi:hypothetical protein